MIHILLSQDYLFVKERGGYFIIVGHNNILVGHDNV